MRGVFLFARFIGLCGPVKMFRRMFQCFVDMKKVHFSAIRVADLFWSGNHRRLFRKEEWQSRQRTHKRVPTFKEKLIEVITSASDR